MQGREIDGRNRKHAAALVCRGDERTLTGRDHFAAAVQRNMNIGQRNRRFRLILRSRSLNTQAVGRSEREFLYGRLLIHIIQKLRRKHAEGIVYALAGSEEQHAAVSHPLHQRAHLPHAELRDLIVADDHDIKGIQLPSVLRKITLGERKGSGLHLPVIHRDAVQIGECLRRIRKQTDEELRFSAALCEFHPLRLRKFPFAVPKPHPKSIRAHAERHHIGGTVSFPRR